jgi:hypothetical protein
MAYNYGKYGIFVIKREECSVCKGSGQIGDDPFEECPNCNGGHGYIETEIPLQNALCEISSSTSTKFAPATDEQINNLIASLFDGFYPWSEDELASMRPLVRNWLAALNQPANAEVQ